MQSAADNTVVSQEHIDGMIETIHGDDVSQTTSSENNGEFERKCVSEVYSAFRLP